MSPSRRALRAVTGAGFLAMSAPAQAVWSMGAPWTDLGAVVSSAAPGDIVLLNGLTFPALSITKGLTILGPGTIAGVNPSTHNVTFVQVPAGQQAHFVDVAFLPLYYLGVPIALNRVDVSGRATFDACTFASGTPWTLAVSGTVLLHHCTVESSQPGFAPALVGGLRVNGGVCSLVASIVNGGRGVATSSTNLIPATPAVRVAGGTLLLSHSTLVGGAGAGPIFGSVPPAPAIEMVAGSANITDCQLTGGAAGGGSNAGATALAGNAATGVARSTLIGGNGPVVGPPSTGPVQTVPQLVGLDIDHGWRLGSTSTITAIAGVQGILGILAGFTGDAVVVPGIDVPVVGVLPAAVTLALAVPAAGAPVVRALAVPNTAQLLGAVLFVQAFQLDGALLRGSAAIGGVVR